MGKIKHRNKYLTKQQRLAMTLKKLNNIEDHDQIKNVICQRMTHRIGGVGNSALSASFGMLTLGALVSKGRVRAGLGLIGDNYMLASDMQRAAEFFLKEHEEKRGNAA